MTTIGTLLATAAMTVGTVAAAKTIKRRILAAEAKLRAAEKRRARRRAAPMVDLEADETTGVYGLKRDRTEIA